MDTVATNKGLSVGTAATQTGKRSHTLRVRLGDAERLWLQEIARAKHMSMSDVVRGLVKQYHGQLSKKS